MAQKIVIFEVAKALKEAGYPQGNTEKCYLTANHNEFYKKGQIVDNTEGEWTVLTKNLADIPTYLDTWLWLWREKKAQFNMLCFGDWTCEVCHNGYIVTRGCPDPEEAIAKAIDYLVENKLLK